MDEPFAIALYLGVIRLFVARRRSGACFPPSARLSLASAISRPLWPVSQAPGLRTRRPPEGNPRRRRHGLEPAWYRRRESTRRWRRATMAAARPSAAHRAFVPDMPATFRPAACAPTASTRTSTSSSARSSAPTPEGGRRLPADFPPIFRCRPGATIRRCRRRSRPARQARLDDLHRAARRRRAQARHDRRRVSSCANAWSSSISPCPTASGPSPISTTSRWPPWSNPTRRPKASPSTA